MCFCVFTLEELKVILWETSRIERHKAESGGGRGRAAGTEVGLERRDLWCVMRGGEKAERQAGLMMVFNARVCWCVGGRVVGGLGGYCSVTLPVSAGGSSHQDIKYATMLTAAPC